jgi:hypothetical protein
MYSDCWFVLTACAHPANAVYNDDADYEYILLYIISI